MKGIRTRRYDLLVVAFPCGCTDTWRRPYEDGKNPHQYTYVRSGVGEVCIAGASKCSYSMDESEEVAKKAQ